MVITDKINEIIDRRIGRNGFEGKGYLEVVVLNFLFNSKYSYINHGILKN